MTDVLTRPSELLTGYGAAFGGLAPPLSMVDACAPGAVVVPVDNSYSIGHVR